MRGPATWLALGSVKLRSDTVVILLCSAMAFMMSDGTRYGQWSDDEVIIDQSDDDDESNEPPKKVFTQSIGASPSKKPVLKPLPGRWHGTIHTIGPIYKVLKQSKCRLICVDRLERGSRTVVSRKQPKGCDAD